MRTLDAVVERYWLAFRVDGWRWVEVDRCQYVTAARFSDSLTLAEEPTVPYFATSDVRGMTTCGDEGP